jgi:predicted DNA-binding transcriptional regulator AlpA
MKSDAEVSDGLVKKAYICRKAAVSLRTLDNWISGNRIPFVKFPTGAVRFIQHDVDAFIEAHRVAPRGAKARTRVTAHKGATKEGGAK